MIAAAKIFVIALKISIARNMAYRANFFIAIAIMIVSELFLPFVSILIYNKGVAFPGWSLYEVLLIQSIFVMSKGIAFPMFIGMVFNVISNVRSGTLDLMMIRPRPLLFTMIITSVVPHDFGKFIGGLALFIYTLMYLPSSGVIQWITFVLLFILSIALIFAFTVLMAVYSIRFVGSDRVFALIEPISQFGLYPLSIYNLPLRIIISNILPVAVIGFIPATVLLQKSADGVIVIILTTIIFIAASLYIWSKTIGKYTSAGG